MTENNAYSKHEVVVLENKASFSGTDVIFTHNRKFAHNFDAIKGEDNIFRGIGVLRNFMVLSKCLKMG